MSGNLGANLINQLQNTPMASPDYWGKQMSNMNALQDYNAKQAWGQALQQATDPTTGQVDYGKAQALAAGNPMARAGMATNLQNTSAIQSQQIDQAHASVSLIGQLSASGIKDPSDANVANIRAQAVNAGAPPGAIAEIDRIAALPENQRANEFYNHNLDSLDAMGRLHRQLGETTAQNIGGQNVAQTVTQGSPGQPGSVTQGTGGITRTLSPESATDLMDVKYPDNTVHQVMRQDLPTEFGKGATLIGPSVGSSGPDPLAKLPKPQALAGVIQRESGGQNVNTRILGPDGKPASSASGVYQMVDGTWQEGAALAGIKNPPPRAIMASRADQDAAASALYDKYGLAPWAKSAPGAARTAATPPANTPPATPPADTTTSALPLPPTPVPPPPGSPFGATAFSQPSTALPAPPSQATAPNTTAAVPAVPTPQKAAAMAIAQRTGRPAPIAGTDGLFVDKNGNVGSGPNAGGLGRRADIPNALLTGVQTAQTTMPPANVLTAGPGAPTTGLPTGPAPTVPPANAFGTGAFGSAPAAAPVTPPPPVVQPPAPIPPQAGRGAGWSAPPGYVSGIETRQKADIDAYTKNSGEVATHQNNVNTLQNAYHALQLADTGPGTQNLQAARAFLQSFGIATSATGDQATQWAEAHKYLMDFARTQGGLGGTDLQAQLAQGSNASTDIPKPAALAVVRNNIAKERLAMAQVQEANGSDGYVDHTKNFAPSQDLRAYQADIMPPQELKQIEALKKTNPEAFKKFQASLDVARKHGLISDEDLAAQNQRIRALGP